MAEVVSRAQECQEQPAPPVSAVETDLPVNKPPAIATSQTSAVTTLLLTGLSVLLLVLSFPNFEIWPLAWIGLTPFLIAISRCTGRRAFFHGWAAGSVFFYATCSWLTYSIINYGHIHPSLAYLSLVPGALLLGVFPGVFALAVARLVSRWGIPALLLAPLVWSSLEWARLGVTGQLWNAIGYSQAYHPRLIGSAQWGGVYFVGFLIVVVNAAIAFSIVSRSIRSLAISLILILAVAGIVGYSGFLAARPVPVVSDSGEITVVVVQPNVPMNPAEASERRSELIERHLALTKSGLQPAGMNRSPRLVIWPESPMNFSYAEDAQFQRLIGNFAREHQTYILFNSEEPAPNESYFNSALLINDEGRLVAQYDKIRLMPFGEFVPLPHWLPGASLITAIVGDFTPGTKYTLMPVGTTRAGVFICIESAYPSIARSFTAEGADVLINISNDGYLGPTAVMRQHLANAIFRAVENDRQLLRVTNTGISAAIGPDGAVYGPTQPFTPEVRLWKIRPTSRNSTFYTRHGDWFAITCTIFSAGLIAAAFVRRKTRTGS